MPFWSMKQTIRDKDMMLKTKMSWRLGRTGRGFGRLVCVFFSSFLFLSFPFLLSLVVNCEAMKNIGKNDPPKVKVSTHY